MTNNDKNKEKKRVSGRKARKKISHMNVSGTYSQQGNVYTDWTIAKQSQLQGKF